MNRQAAFFMSVFFIKIGFVAVGAEQDVRHPVRRSSHLFADDIQINSRAAFDDKLIMNVTDDEAVHAFEYLSRTEGIIPAIESSHALAHALKIAPDMSPDQIIVVTLSGRGDKDCAAIARYRGEDIHE